MKSIKCPTCKGEAILKEINREGKDNLFSFFCGECITGTQLYASEIAATTAWEKQTAIKKGAKSNGN